MNSTWFIFNSKFSKPMGLLLLLKYLVFPELCSDNQFLPIYFQKIVVRVEDQWLWEYISKGTKEIEILKFSHLSLCFPSTLCYSRQVDFFPRVCSSHFCCSLFPSFHRDSLSTYSVQILFWILRIETEQD